MFCTIFTQLAYSHVQILLDLESVLTGGQNSHEAKYLLRGSLHRGGPFQAQLGDIYCESQSDLSATGQLVTWALQLCHH